MADTDTIVPKETTTEKTPSERSAELEAQVLQHVVERFPEEDKRRAESERRQDEAIAKQNELNQRLREEEIKDLEANRAWREQHPRPVPPQTPAPPQFHLTPPPGLFGDSGTPQGQSAPGNQWMQAITAFGALGSSTDRRSSMAAIAAMTGMLEGYAKGEKMVFDEQYKVWEAQTRNIENNYRRQTEYYDAILSDNKLSMQEKQSELALRAGEFKDTITQELLVQGRLDQFDKLQLERAGIIEKLATAQKKIQDNVTAANIPGGLTGAAENYNQTGQLTGRNSKMNAAIMEEADRMLTEEQGLTTPAARQEWRMNNWVAWKERVTSATTTSRLTAAAPIQTEQAELRRTDQFLINTRSWAQFVTAQFDRLVELGSRRHKQLGIPIADAFITHGQAALQGDPDAVLFMAQLPSVQNEVEGVLTRGASQGALSVHAQQAGAALIPAGYSSDNLRRMKTLFEGDFANRERFLIEESNRHRQALRDHGVDIQLLTEPEVPPLPPPGRGETFKPPSDWEYSPSRKQYRDRSGKLYDINGNPI
jgi:hypothetical protein